MKKSFSNLLKFSNRIALIMAAILLMATAAQTQITMPKLLPTGLDISLGRPISLIQNNQKIIIKNQSDNANFANTIDGDTESKWCPSSQAKSYYLKIDLGQDRRLTGTAITWASNATNFKANFEILRDNQWLVLHSDSKNSLNWATQKQPLNASARYVRFSVIGTKTLPCIRAIRVFALALAPNNNFIIGHDLSTVIQLEDIGKTFSEQGITQPIEKILVNHQSNLVRLRLWVNPLENFNNLAQVKRMAIRVKAAGMKFLLDFHYSDTWADPGHQDIPKDWAGQDLSSLTKSVREYSQAVIAELVAQNTAPDMVQIGNEITNGMLYPLGKIEGSSQAGFQNFAQLLQAGIQGTRAGMPAGHAYEIMIHIDRGANAFVTQSFFERLEQAQISFDVIGLSYYPYWNGSLSSLRTSLDGLAKRFKKPIIITETAYPWTLKDFDNYPNIIGAGTTLPDAYSPSIEGQALFLRDLLSVIAQIPNNLGRGMIYWESAWLSGIPWKPQEGNAWDNQTLFSATGEALESLQAFHLR